MLLGFLILNQAPGAAGVIGILFVVAAGVGAARSGARATPVPLEVG
jgi:inner membrane transporter RhtA